LLIFYEHPQIGDCKKKLSMDILQFGKIVLSLQQLPKFWFIKTIHSVSLQQCASLFPDMSTHFRRLLLSNDELFAQSKAHHLTNRKRSLFSTEGEDWSEPCLHKFSSVLKRVLKK